MESKKGLIYLFVFIFQLGLAVALAVTLNEPADSIYLPAGNVNFLCSGDSSVINATLYTNASGTWAANLFNSTPSNNKFSFSQTFSLGGKSQLAVIWNCLITDSSNNKKFASANRTFILTSIPMVPPALNSSIPPITFDEDSIYNSLDLDSYFSDPGDTMNYFCPFVVEGLSISLGNDGVVTITPDKDWYGNALINFTARDSTGLSATSNIVNVTITSVNDVPKFDEFKKIPDMDLRYNGTIDLSIYFSDGDGETLAYMLSTAPNITMTIENDIASFTYDPGLKGFRSVILEAKDPSGASARSNAFALSVDYTPPSSNKAPQIVSYNPAVLPTVTGGQSFSIQKKDMDNDTLTVKWYLDGNIIPNAVSDTYNYTNPLPGNHSISALISDGKETANYTWKFTVGTLQDQDTNLPENKTETIPEEEQTEKVCGDKVVTEDEDCNTCPADVPCGEGEECIEGICVPPSNSGSGLIIAGALLGFFALVGIFIHFFVTKKTAKPINESGPSAYEQKPSLSPSYKAPDVLPEKPAEVYTPPTTSVAQQLPTEKPAKAIEQDPLKAYIERMLDKGFKPEEVRQKLVSAGWPLDKISKAFKEMGI